MGAEEPALRPIAALAAASVLATTVPAAAAPAPPSGFSGLAAGQAVHGFRASARYHDAAGAPIGARFTHERSGFTLDMLAIQSVPQGLVWVSTWPTSDKGEPHTQEHLLLGKGNRGRAVATLDSMSLAETSAYTEQRRTVYQLATAAGAEVFHQLLEAHLDALLHPDYTDEEVRREVRNFGVTSGPGGLRLEEQGTVYNEMSSTFEKPWTRLFHELGLALHGPGHPLSHVAGGSPEALRTLTPADIRAFHAANYHLAHMGMVASLPADMPLGPTLARFDAMLGRVEPGAAAFAGKTRRDADLPPPQGAPAGTIRIVGYPDASAAAPGHLILAWPATLRWTDARDRLLAELFSGALAGDATTNLYKRFIDSKTRRLDIGATGVYARFDEEPGHALQVSFSDVGAAHLTPDTIAKLRAHVSAELTEVASWKDGSPALAAFDARVLALIHATRRSLGKFVNSPPGFGFRGTYSSWLTHLDQLAEQPGFEKAVTLGRDLDAIEALVAGRRNIWRQRLTAWRLLGVQPIAVAVKADPALAARERAAREARLAAETARLQARYGARDAQATLARFKAEADADTAALKALEAAAAPARFLAQPPLGRDPDLAFRSLTLAPGIPVVATTFDSMTGAAATLALRLDGLTGDQLVYLAMLPDLLTDVGVIEAGQAISHEEVTRRLRTEILGVSASFQVNPRKRRIELAIRGSGTTAAEAERAVAWMRRLAFAPDWRPANLPRLRDVVDQGLGALRQQMKGAEEHWVRDPANAVRFQDDPLVLATASFLTREHQAHRLSWLLRDAGPAADRAAIVDYLQALAAAAPGRTRAELASLAATLADGPLAEQAGSPTAQPLQAGLGRLPAGARAHAIEAAKDLAHYVADLPEPTLAADWAYLCRQMRDDLLVQPAAALAELETVRKTLLAAPRARLALVGSRPRQDALLGGPLAAFMGQLAGGDRPGPAAPAAPGLVTARLRERHPGARPLFVGLVAPNSQSGVFVNTAPAPTYQDTDRESLLRFLTAKLYGGGGAHSIFMKTWGAGLAYSNGLSSSADSGTLSYYAERCPELPQTLGFVVRELQAARPNPALVEYAYALAFDDSRAAWAYESRGEAIASDLADGVTPAVVQRFREALLALRAEPDLAQALFARLAPTYGAVLPGLAGPARDVAGASYFVVGPEPQMVAYAHHLKGSQGADTQLYRLYPRDFWLTARPRVE